MADVDALYRAYRTVPLKAALDTGATWDEADDIAQETWARLIEHGDVRNHAAWLGVTARNITVSLLRAKRTARKYAPALAGDYAANVPPADHEVIARHQAAWLLSLLSARQRDIVTAVADYGHQGRAARAAGMAPGTAKVQMFRARRILSEAIHG